MSAVLTPPPKPAAMTADEFMEKYAGASVEFLFGEVVPAGLPANMRTAGASVPQPAVNSPEVVLVRKADPDTWAVMLERVVVHLTNGVRAVVVLDSVTRSASIYRADVLPQTLEAADTLTLPDMLPGFAVPVGKFFD